MSESRATTSSSSTAPPEVENSINRLVPVLRNYTPEEIDAVRMRLESLLERRQPDPAAPTQQAVGRV